MSHRRSSSASSAFPAIARLAATTGCLGLASAVLAAAAPPAPPRPPVPVDPPVVDAAASGIDRLPERLDRIAAELESLLAEHHVPGAGLAIVVDGEPVLVRGFGLRDLVSGEPVTGDTRFAIGSATKSMTALLAAAAEADGGPALDDHVTELLPEFRFHDEQTNAAITFADLLAHTSGVMRTDLLWYGGYADWEDIVAGFARAEPVADLGEAFNYQNVCYLAAGRILGEWSKRGWDGHLASRILRPLGMDSSGADVELLLDPEHAATGYDHLELGKYAPRDEAGTPILPWIPPGDLVVNEGGKDYWRRRAPRDLSSIAPAGAVVSTPRDMARWVAFVGRRGVGPDGTRLLPEEAFDAAWTPRITAGPGVQYGLGFFLREWRGRRMVDHGGNIDGFATAVNWLPDEGIGFALLTNLTVTPATSLAADVILGGLLEPFEAVVGEGDAGGPAADATALERFVGEYDASLLFGQPVTVLVREGRLAMDVPGQMVFQLGPPDEEGMRSFVGFPQIRVRFVDEDRPIGAGDDDDDEADEAGDDDSAAASMPVRSVELHQNGLVFEWLKDGASFPIEVPLEDLTNLLGTYRGEDMPRGHRVLVRQNRLSIEVPGELTYALHPPDEDGWWTFRETNRAAVRFEFEAAGEATGPATAIVIRTPGGEVRLPREQTGDDDPLPDVRIVEFSVQTAQGRDEWEARLGLRLRGRVRMVNQGLEGPCTLDLAGYDRLRDRLDMGLYGWMESGMFGRRAWFDASFQPFQELPEGAATTLGQMHPALPMADWRQVYDSVAVVGRREVGDRRLVAVQAERDGERPTTILVDEETWLVHSLETTVLVPNMGMIPRTITFEDYRDIAGVQLPMRIITEDMGLGRVERVYEEWELDPTFGPEVFRKNDPAG